METFCMNKIYARLLIHYNFEKLIEKKNVPVKFVCMSTYFCGARIAEIIQEFLSVILGENSHPKSLT